MIRGVRFPQAALLREEAGLAHIPRALVVEDDARMRRIVAKVLTGCGMIVRAAGDGVEALNAFRASREEPELICADIRMPNMDGREFARRLRHEGVDVPIIFVSGTIAKDQEGYREKSHVYLVSKPFSPNDLAAIAKDMLAKPRPRLGARSVAAPLGGPADLAPLPPDPSSTTGFSPEDFPKKAKSACLVVPQSPDRPFSGGGQAPAVDGEAPALQPQPLPQPASPGGRKTKKAHETTVIFLKPISATEVPSASQSSFGLRRESGEEGPAPAAAQSTTPAKSSAAPEAKVPVPPATKGAVAPAAGVPAVSAAPVPPSGAAAAAAASPVRNVNVERRIYESDVPGQSKPGNWIPRLIIWTEESDREAQRLWCEIVASALGTIQAAGGLQAFAFAAAPANEAPKRRWRVRAGVRIDGALFQAILTRKLRGLLLLAPRELEAGVFDQFLSAEHLDRGNVLTLGSILADLDCTGREPLAELTFLKEETAFLHSLNAACGRNGCAMRRAEWKPRS